MARIAMDPNQVRAMANTANQTAESIHAHMSEIVSVVQAAEWQSLARDEFIERVETLSRINTQSIRALRLMGDAANQKARQWEAKASHFNAPLEALGGAWSSFLDLLNNTWQGLLNSISQAVIGGFTIIGGSLISIGDWFENIKFPWETTETPSPTDPETQPGTVQLEPDPVPETPPSQPTSTDRGYPYPPNKIELKEKKDISSCALYAQGRRPDLGPTSVGVTKEKYPDSFEPEAAANYRFKFADKAFQIGEGERGNLENVIGEGYAITWDPGSKRNPTDKYYLGAPRWGHVAIVEKVYNDYVVISEATRLTENGPYVYHSRQISFADLDHEAVWFIP